jgi:hypothetical protein
VAYGARLESVLSESSRGFESRILRHTDLDGCLLLCWVDGTSRGINNSRKRASFPALWPPPNRTRPEDSAAWCCCKCRLSSALERCNVRAHGAQRTMDLRAWH